MSFYLRQLFDLPAKPAQQPLPLLFFTPTHSPTKLLFSTAFFHCTCPYQDDSRHYHRHRQCTNLFRLGESRLSWKCDYIASEHVTFTFILDNFQWITPKSDSTFKTANKRRNFWDLKMWTFLYPVSPLSLILLFCYVRNIANFTFWCGPMTRYSRIKLWTNQR